MSVCHASRALPALGVRSLQPKRLNYSRSRQFVVQEALANKTMVGWFCSIGLIQHRFSSRLRLFFTLMLLLMDVI